MDPCSGSNLRTMFRLHFIPEGWIARCMLCLLCQKKIRLIKIVCFSCQKDIFRMYDPRYCVISNEKKKMRVLSLCRYGKKLRELIVLSKVDNNFRAQIYLSYFFGHLFAKHFPITMNDNSNTTVYSVPNSSWSRFWGKFDLAYHMQASLASRGGFPVGTVSAPSLWPKLKQAQRERGERLLCDNTFKVRVREKSLLIFKMPSTILVDDVMASGVTLWNVEIYPKEFAITLAYAPLSEAL